MNNNNRTNWMRKHTIRLRLGLLYEDLSVRFNVCLSVVTRIVKKWINLMYINLSFQIAWPEQ